MIWQYIKNLFGKDKPVSNPTQHSATVTHYSPLNIRTNSRINIDTTEFDIYGHLLIMPHPGQSLIVSAIHRFQNYGTIVHDVHCKSQQGVSSAYYILRIQEDEITHEITMITLLSVINFLYFSTGEEWLAFNDRLNANEYTITLNTPGSPGFDASFPENVQIQYFTDMYETYEYNSTQLFPASSTTTSAYGKEFNRIIRDGINNQPVKEFLVVEVVDKSHVREYCGVDINPAGLTVI